MKTCVPVTILLITACGLLLHLHPPHLFPAPYPAWKGEGVLQSWHLKSQPLGGRAGPGQPESLSSSVLRWEASFIASSMKDK